MVHIIACMLGLIALIIGVVTESWFFAIAGGVIAWACYGDYNTQQAQENLNKEKIDNIQNFISSSQKLVEDTIGYIPDIGRLCEIPSGVGNIYIDISKEKIILINPDLSLSVYDPSQIIDTSISEDGAVLTSSKNENLLGRAVGGAILGGTTGAIIGGSTAQKINSTQVVNSVSVLIHVDDIKNHTCEVKFLPYQAEKGSPLHDQSLREARDFHGALTVLIHRAKHQTQ